MEKEFDFKSSTKAAIEKVNHTSYSKLAFIAIAIGVSFSLSFYGIGKLQEKFAKTELVSLESKKNKTELIKEISNEEFQNFLSYLGNTANMYDLQASLITNALIKAEQENWMRTTNSGNAVTDINKELISYKQKLEGDITNISNIYYQIQKNTSLENIEEKEIKLFNSYYSNYKAGLYKRDDSVEKTLTKWLYNTDKYNLSFNDKNGINEQYRELAEKNRMVKF